MKKIILPVGLLIILSLCFGDFINPEGSQLARLYRNMTDGSATFNVRTATYNGQYAPKNAGVIWITNSQNQFVKTVKIWASSYRSALVRWISSSGQNTNGAITSASINTHQLHNITWNGTNAQGVAVPDGDYKFNVEFAEHNANSSNMGKFKQVTFTKGSTPVNLTLTDETYFKNMSLTWVPTIVNGTLSGTVTSSMGTPIQGAVIMAGSFNVVSSATGSYSLSLSPGLWNVSCTVNGYITQQMNNVQITASTPTVVDFNMVTVGIEDETTPSAYLSLSQGYPNPFKEFTSLSFSTKVPGMVAAQVFDLKGRYIRQLNADSSTTVAWDGRDDAGRYCVNGIYFVRVESGNFSATRKVILQR
ncbi:hypothetical protein MASR2M64_14900 [Candidatus Cloacimonadota bacterium]